MVAIYLAQESQAIEWLVTASDQRSTWPDVSNCSRPAALANVLARHQRVLCRKNVDLMPLLSRAARDTMDICQELFADRRWNCSSILMAPSFMPDLTAGSREQAFVFCLSSASLVHSVSKGCSAGLTDRCQCGRTPNEAPPVNFKWGGCGDDLGFGVIFTRTFTDTHWAKKRKTRQSLVNLHNNGVGRKVIAESLSTVCKCHGVSGSCSVKTCWKSLPDMRTIGSIVQRRYSLALEVEYRKSSNETRLVASVAERKSITDDDLVYTTISPDYCLPDPALGSIGTRHRECLRDHPGSVGCRSMCCGRGFTTVAVEISHRCDCKYYWCCYVKCKTCTKVAEVNRCR